MTACVPALLLRTRSLSLAGNALAAAPFLGLTTVAVASGGQAVAALLMLPFLPLVPALVSGRRSAIAWTGIVCGEIALLWWARSVGMPAWIEPNPLAAEAAVFRAPLLGALLLLAGIVAYESVTERAYRLSSVHRRLERARQRFRQLLELSPDGICTLHGGRIEYANTTLCNLAGLKGADDLRGSDLDELFVGTLPPVARAETFARDRRRLAHPSELQLRRADGGSLSVEVSIAAQPPAGSGELLLVVRDLTKRKLQEEQTRQSQKMEAVGHLAGGVAHDFNNLLTVIQSEVEGLLEQTPLSRSERRQRIEQIGDAAERSAALTHKLLAFSRRQLLRPQALDVNAVVSGLLDMLRRVVPEDIAIETDLAASSPALLADPVQLEQVILNLVVNARDAGAHQIVLATGTPARSKDDDRVFLTIRDDGQGMDPDTQERAFDPFFTSKQPGAGTGLGLSTVHGIVHQSGGSVELESEVGRGTTVRVILPRASAAPTRRAPEPRPDRAAGSETVLLVEDEPIVRRLARRSLEAAGFSVLEACDGVDALELARCAAQPFQLVVSDLVMPRMGGAELVDRLRAHSPELAVLFISGYSADADSLPRGAELLSKPFTGHRLAAEARRALDVAAARAAD